MKNVLLAITSGLLMLAVSGCTTIDSSHIITGTTHTATKPEQVKLYSDAPATPFEVIGIVSISANNDWVNGQELLDDAITALKQEAAKLGANGILIQGVNAHKSTNGGIIANDDDKLGWLFSNNSYEKNIQAKAIYVQPVTQ